MSPRPHQIPALLAAAIGLAILASPATALAADAVVKDIRVEGNRRVEGDAVRGAMVTKKGAPFDPKKAGQDVKAIMKLGLFSDVVIEKEGSPEAPVLVVRQSSRANR